MSGIAEESLPEVQTYRFDLARIGTPNQICYFLLIQEVGGLLVMVVVCLQIVGWTWPEIQNAEAYEFLLCGIAFLAYVVGSVAIAVVLTNSRLLKRISLSLDREGLTRSRLLSSTRWHWSELSPFAHESSENPPNISFHLPGQKPDSLRKGMIADLYDAPLTEIADTLNKFRERALTEAES